MTDRSLSRRAFAKLATGAGLAATTAACASEAPVEGTERSPVLPAPPVDAKVVPTACDHCIVGCGYEVLTWPVDAETSAPREGMDAWYAPNMHSIVQIGGKAHHAVVRPDRSTAVVNTGGNYSVRGGTLAQKLYSEERETRDRLARPKLRVGDELVEITWDEALAIVAGVSRHVIDTHGELSWGMKMYSYQYYENTYALTKLALDAVKTPVWAVHDKPSAAPDVPGLQDAGINAFNCSYSDWRDSEVIFVSGVSLYDAKSILFHDWVAKGGAKLVVVNPRRDMTASFALARGGLHLQLIPGTDTLLQNAIARVVIENGWEDAEFIAARTASRAEVDLETGFRTKELGLSFDEYRSFILSEPLHVPEAAAAVTGVPAEQIREAARMLAAPKPDGSRPKASFMLEKGNYWSHNVDNTASLASLGLLCGAGGRAGRVIARAGGHQRGMMSAAKYPLDLSPDRYGESRIPLNVDRWVTEGRARFMWVVGTTWLAAMGAATHLGRVIRILTRETAPPSRDDLLDAFGRVDVERAIAALNAKTDALGMVLVQQEIYENPLTELADLVLPAATWGEADFTRMQGERRLRIYSKFMDPPGEAKPDWWIAAEVAKRMGYTGFDWADENAIFEEASARSAGTEHDYVGLVEKARAAGTRGHEVLRSLGTTGIQCPITTGAGGDLEGTVRLHDEGFKTTSKKAIFIRGSWARVAPVQAELEPQGDELWVTNMRVNALWQSLQDDVRIPFRIDRFPESFLEIHPDDAKARRIENGDILRIESQSVQNHNGQLHTGSITAVAYVTDAVRPGVTACYFNFGGGLDTAVNCLTSGIVDPMNPVYRYKLGRGRVTRIERSAARDDLCFSPANRPA
jgi:arsenite oxidase large subunit